MNTFPVTGSGAVRVRIEMGRVDVIASDRDDIAVSVSPSRPSRSRDRAAAEAVRVDRVGRVLAVTGPSRPRVLGPRDDSVDVVVEVPHGSLAEVEVKFGSAHLGGSLGAVDLDVAYGDATVETASRLELRGGHGQARVGRVFGDADVRLKSGSVRVDHVGGSLRVSGADGAVIVGSVSGSTDVVTSSGAVQLGTIEGPLTMKSAYGGVRVRELVAGSARIESSYGNVAVGVRGGTAVWLDATSQHGTVRTDLAADAGPAAGEDALELHIRTGYASIHVHRAEAPPGS
jgi:Holliday junction resolvase-like predicted endonuclease